MDGKKTVINDHATQNWVQRRTRRKGREDQLPAHVLHRLREIFDLIDENNSGTLNVTELNSAFKVRVGVFLSLRALADPAPPNQQRKQPAPPARTPLAVSRRTSLSL